MQEIRKGFAFGTLTSNIDEARGGLVHECTLGEGANEGRREQAMVKQAAACRVKEKNKGEERVARTSKFTREEGQENAN